MTAYWESGGVDGSGRKSLLLGDSQMDRENATNRRCFFGFPSCNFVFESLRLCFIACPSDVEYELELDIIRAELEKRRYEPYIAVKRFEGGKNVFCSKICSKIITAKFCIVLLNDSEHPMEKDVYMPNPNVHYEYGIMAALHKEVIPMQREGTRLAFNISPLDTIIYNKSDFKRRLIEAIDEAIDLVEESDNTGPIEGQDRDVLSYMSLRGFVLADEENEFNSGVAIWGADVGFMLFTGKRLCFLGNFRNEPHEVVAFNLQLLHQNLTAAIERAFELTGPHTFDRDGLLVARQEQSRLRMLFGEVDIVLVVSDHIRKEALLEMNSRRKSEFVKINLTVITFQEVQSVVHESIDSLRSM